MNKIKIKSPAKINLFLRVLEENDSGYHNIETSFQYVDLYDLMSFELIDEGIKIRSNKAFLENKDNTIYKSAKLLLDMLDHKIGVNISIEKNIPIGAGLGGGSSNAASTISVLNKLWNLNLTKDVLMETAIKIGADVPFFVNGENAYGKGIGEKLETRESIKNKILLIYPEIHNSSESMFNLLDAQRKNNNNIKHHMQNDFWNIFLSENKKIKNFYEANKKYEIKLSGSGSCMYIFYEKENDIKEILKKIPSNWRFFFCKPLQYSPICYIK